MSKHTEDIIMKSVMDLFKGDAVKFFGIDKKVVAVARTNLSHIAVQRNINDWVLEMEDGMLYHFEFESGYDRKDLVRFMVADAMLYANEGKPIRTIVVYSADIRKTATTLDAGAIQYSVDAFYMSRLDGDRTYEGLRDKVEAGETLNKQDLMSIVFLPLMNNSVGKDTRFEQAAALSMGIEAYDEKLQIQAMITLLSEKFIQDTGKLRRIEEVMNMGALVEMILADGRLEGRAEGIAEGRLEGRAEGKLEGRTEGIAYVAKSMLRDNFTIDTIAKYTGLTESAILELQKTAIS